MKAGFRSSEFWLLASCTAFAMWAGGYSLIHTGVDLDRLLAIIGAVAGIGGFWTYQRTGLKKVVEGEESSTTT